MQVEPCLPLEVSGLGSPRNQQPSHHLAPLNPEVLQISPKIYGPPPRAILGAPLHQVQVTKITPSGRLWCARP